MSGPMVQSTITRPPRPSAAMHRRHRFPDVRAVIAALEPSYPVYCLRPEVMAETARRFIALFPGTVLYAVKCNPHPFVIDTLYEAGIRHFDTASLTEIAQICETHPDARSYFMHPVKARAVIKSAYSVYGVRHFVVDHESELEKVLEVTGGSDVVIVVRLQTPAASDTLYHLSAKFGAPQDEAAALLAEAHRRGCKVGVAFHVGSQCGVPQAYRDAINLAWGTVARAGVPVVSLDVGGGFPATYANYNVPPIEDYMDAVCAGLEDIALGPEVEVLAEPGRALVANSCSLLTQVQLRKDERLYINDGIYGSLSEMIQGHVRMPVRLIRLDGEPSSRTRAFVLNGPTCDALDVVPGTFELPDDVREGDWIEIDQIGAYSNALATRFNGFYPDTYVEVHDEPPAAEE